MRLPWRLRSSKSDEDFSVTLESAPQLQQYEIDLDPPPPLSVRLKRTIKESVESIGWSLTVQKTVLALSLDFVCLVYQTVDLYKNVYPGSKIAANILRNSHTIVAWDTYFWVLSTGAAVANFFVVKEWMIFLTEYFRVPLSWVARIVRFQLLCGFIIWVVVLVVLPTLLVGPMWITFALRYLWQDLAWNHGCPGWDYTIILNVDSYGYFNADLMSLGNVTSKGPNSSYTMALSQFTAFPSQYVFNVTDTFNIIPHLPFIWYNMTDLTYISAESPIPFVVAPNLVFPALGLSQKDPSIPFLRQDQSSYPPSADLVYRNGSRVLTTVTQNYPDLTELLACGMEDSTGALQIALGVVAIEQWIYLNASSNLLS